MATRFDPDFNAEIRRVVKNFNQKRNRAYKRGFSYLPDKVLVSDIKATYKTKAEVQKYLNSLEKFNKMRDLAYEIVETKGGGRTSRFKLEFIRDNLEDTKDFFDRQIAEAKELFYEDQYSIARRDYLFNLEVKRKYLEQDIEYLNQSGLKTFERYTHQAIDYGRQQITGYRNFLNVVELAMRNVGYDEKRIGSFFDKMSELSPAQFIKMYRSSPVIARIYDLITSPEHGQTILTTNEEDAKLLLDMLDKNFYDIKDSALK